MYIIDIAYVNNSLNSLGSYSKNLKKKKKVS